MAQAKSVTLVVIDACKVAGRHVSVGDILPDVPLDLALELTGAGRTRRATDEDLSKAKAYKNDKQPALA
jgi:hypothetical protein